MKLLIVDLCYYVIRNESTTDIQDKKFMEMKENEIWTNSKKKEKINLFLMKKIIKKTYLKKL